jgi:hypothetical protein
MDLMAMNTPTTEWIAQAMCYGFLRAMYRKSPAGEDASRVEGRLEEHEYALAAMAQNWRPWMPAATDFLKNIEPPPEPERQLPGN